MDSGEVIQTENSMAGMFAKVAGDDMEVDALELKQILDYALKKGNNSNIPLLTIL